MRNEGLCDAGDGGSASGAHICAGGKEIPSQDLIKIVLKGQVSPECDLDLLWMKRKLESDYYFLKIKDQTKVAVRAEDYQYDRSLKGEFVRLVQETDLSEEDQSEILKLGIQALKGEA